ncbi:MAG TPA: hypothetical protein VGJ84_19965 [Polyangiaceae bacterium]
MTSKQSTPRMPSTERASDGRDTDPDTAPPEIPISVQLPISPVPISSVPISPTPAAEIRPSADTLLSAPTPADRDDTELLDRMRVIEQRLADVELRLGFVERARLAAPKWGIWVAFLVGLALLWELSQRLR